MSYNEIRKNEEKEFEKKVKVCAAHGEAIMGVLEAQFGAQAFIDQVKKMSATILANMESRDLNLEEVNMILSKMLHIAKNNPNVSDAQMHAKLIEMVNEYTWGQLTGLLHSKKLSTLRK